MSETTLSVNGAPQKRLSHFEVLFIVALASWTMLFGTFILSFLLARTKSAIWPPLEVARFPLFLPVISTVVLFVSSVCIHRGYKAYLDYTLDRQKLQSFSSFKFFWGLGLLLGFFFAALQGLSLYRWFELGVDYKVHVYASSIYFLVAFHALHLIVGQAGLIYANFKPKAETLKLWSWFWHFLDVIWVTIFLAIAL